MSSKPIRLARVLALGCLAAFGPLTVGQAVAQQGRELPAGVVPAQNQSLAWDALQAMPVNVMAGEPWVRPERFGSFKLNTAAMRAALAKAPLEFSPEANNPAVIEIPLPDGTLGLFECVESPIMAPELQAKFPEIRTYLVWSAQDRSINGRIDLTPRGFHAMIFTTEGETIFVDPVTRNDAVHHASYFRSDLKSSKQWQCEFDPKEHNLREEIPVEFQGIAGDTEATGTELRTYRLALACTGEYAAFHGGTVAGVAAAMATTVNRVVGVYEKEVAVRLVLVANNNSLIYLNSATDPYTNGNGSTMLGQNQTTITSVIGSANYDIGHVVSTGGGGVAGLGVVCSSTNKSRGVTGSPSPVGDAFDIDYVAHEMGHQFGGNHTFNGNDANCNANRNASTAYEPGSGSTIMAYAGICSPNDLQSNSDAYFHSVSYDEIVAFTRTGGGNSCDVPTATTNNPPTVSAGPTYTIPVNTRFTLTATGSDPDSDPLTYCWEERDLGVATALSTADNGSSPIYRSRTGTTNPSRTFPQTTTVGGLTAVTGEKFPITNRTMRFRVTARDNRAGGGGVNAAETTVTSVVGTAFAVTSPNTAVSWASGSSQTITWTNTGTAAAPINTANVRILLSTNGGSTFPTVLAASVPNTGSAVVTLPTLASTTNTCRIQIEAVGNIYFDLSNVNFTITASTAPAAPTGVAASPSTICVGASTALSGTVTAGNVIDWYTGSCGGTLVGTGSPFNVSPASTTTYFARARNTTSGLVSATCTTVSVTVNPLPTDPTGASVDRNGFCAGDTGNITLTATGGSGTTLTWFSDSCGGTVVGTGNNLSIASPAVATTYFARWSTTCGNSTCASVSVDVNTADLTLDGSIDFGDFLAFFNCYDLEDSCADLDGNPGVDFGDFLAFFNGYDLGC
jgi:hypothetical protein